MLNTLANTQVERLFWARPISTAGMVAAFVGVAVLSVYLYRRSWGLKPWLRIALGLARLIVMALVVAVLFEPMAVVRESDTKPRRLPVLIDVSRSMAAQDPRKLPGDIADAAVALNLVPLSDVEKAGNVPLNLDANQRRAVASASRLDLATRLLSETSRSVFEKLGQHVDVSYHTFGDSVRLVSSARVLPTAVANGLAADENSTSIAQSLETVAKSGNAMPTGIVLLSDGAESDTSPRAEAVLRDLGARGIPVYTVPIGLADPDDVSIRNVVMQEVAYSGDSVPVRVQIQSKGYEKRTARLSVMLNGRRVASRTIRLEGGLQFEEIDFGVDVYEKGAVQVDIQIDPFEDEATAINNRVVRSVRVVNEKVNVLYIEGNPRWEYRYLRAILKRDPRIHATFISSNAGPEVARNSPDHIERFPGNREQAFQYDLVILGDVDSAFFSAEELALLDELIRDRGASLIVLCGAMHTPGSYSGTVVADMLPVRFDPDAPWEDVNESAYPVLTADGRSSLVMTLENDNELNDRVWSRVAPMDHLPPLTSAKAGAHVLAVLSDTSAKDQAYPLVAWQRYGTGKCMSIATDRLWRLRYMAGDKYHWRIWSQCIQFMTLSRLMGEHKRIRLETDRVVYPIGQQSRLYAHVLDDNYDPVIQPSFDVYVTLLGDTPVKERVRLRPDRAQPGMYEGFYSPAKPGRYRLESNENDRPISNSTEFQVADQNSELNDTHADTENLQRIAQLTGGRCLGVRELPELQSLIDTEPVKSVYRSEVTLWDNGYVALLLIGLMGIEWLERRRHDLP
ncbi:MAG: hypothetical protein GC164_13270 [Phycisphaera sp.]|nr:hypothetical protein [Phycisphaera sp.]